MPARELAEGRACTKTIYFNMPMLCTSGKNRAKTATCYHQKQRLTASSALGAPSLRHRALYPPDAVAASIFLQTFVVSTDVRAGPATTATRVAGARRRRADAGQTANTGPVQQTLQDVAAWSARMGKIQDNLLKYHYFLGCFPVSLPARTTATSACQTLESSARKPDNRPSPDTFA